eukprot:c19137_g2_i1 orf=102-2507(+)
MVSSSASLAQAGLCGRLGTLYTNSPFTRSVGSKQQQAYVLHGFRNSNIRCNNKQPTKEASEPISKIEGKSSRQRSRKHQLKRQALASYKSRFAQALQAELNAEQQEIKDRLRNWPKQKLESEGLALFDLCVRHEGSLYRDRVLRFYTRAGDGVLPSHNQFSQGDIVVMSRNHPLAEDEGVVEGVVLERARRFVRVAVPFSQSRDLNLQRRWRLDLYANHITYERCLFAVDIFSSPWAQQQGAIYQLETTEKMSKSPFGWPLEDRFKFGEGASAIRGLLMKCEANLHSSPEQGETSSDEEEKSGAFDASRGSEVLEGLKVMKSPPSKLSGKNLGDAKGNIRAYLQTIGEKLNTSQKAAIETAALQKVTLWQGPPGTGKTKTLTHLIAALCGRREKVLACADSNVAVDNLVEGLLGLGLRVARVGQPVKVKEELRNCTVDAQVANHPLMKKAAERKNTSIEQMRRSRQVNNTKRRADSVKDSKLLWERAEDLEARAIKDVLNRVDVVACTCIGAGDQVLMSCSFTVCVIDEATQATEPATLVPILNSGADSVVLVGDPVQLPPTVLSSEALMAGLDVSLYQHLQECGLKPCFLDTQYRMHPEIAALPSQLFYSGKLKSHASPSDRPAPKGLPWPNVMKPIVFMDCVDGREESTSESTSWFNHVEATQVIKVLSQLKSGDDMMSGWEGIGVIAPYSAQVRLLHDLLFLDGKDGHHEYASLEVKTVDGFQGREKEVIVFCTVRANSRGELGFVSDPRRMNVALTRAKRGLVVIGNSKTLESDKNWATWLAQIKKQRLFYVIELNS